jgi:predicted O-linked N-acetylglucosamine transferase (SPINDLY family)
VTTTIDMAISLHGQGRLAEAEQAYRSVLARDPDQFDALHLLGLVRLQQGDAAAAHALIARAVAGRPQATDALCNLSAALLALDRHGEALAICERVLALSPGDVETLYNQGQAQLHLRRYRDALASYDRVLAARPTHINALLGRGNALTGLDRFADALASCNQLLALNPTHVLALNNQGNLLTNLGRPGDALASFERALALRADDATVLRNRANALAKLGRYEEALASLDRALAVEPAHGATLKHRTLILQMLGRHHDALAACDELLQRWPDDVEALVNRGASLSALDRSLEALACHDRALQIEPDRIEALNNLGTALCELGRPQEGLQSYDRILGIDPDHIEALNNRGVALAALGRREEALASHNRALAIRPRYADALSNRSTVLAQLGRLREALASCEQALAAKPDHVKALINRGMLLGKHERHEEALAALARALVLAPADIEALSARGFLLRRLRRQEEALADFERVAAAAPDTPYIPGALVHAKMHLCDWTDLGAELERLTSALRAGKPASEPFPLLAIDVSAAQQLRAAEIFTADRYPAPPSPFRSGDQHSHERIRIGYLSGEFREQATSYLIAELFELHDRKRFEIFAISTGGDDASPIRRRIAQAADRYLEAGDRSDAELGALLHEHEIDILINLNGYFGDERTGVFALRPAPLQASYLGYPASMGADYIDYIIADPFVIPPSEQSAYSEKVIYLPETYQVNDKKREIAAEVMPRAAAGLPQDAFVFCCFNQSYKIAPAVFDVWMRLLRQIEGSVLWLLSGNATVAQNLRREAQARGVDAQRIVFAPFMKLDKHLARHRLADLFLDTLPLNAHTTASDALWAGLPVVTCTGSTFGGRVAGSLLHAVGLGELVTTSLVDYESLALHLARDRTALAQIKERLAHNRLTCPLFDSDRLRRHIEAAYMKMWEIRQRGEEPRSFSIDPL